MAILNPDYTNLNFEDMATAIGLKAKHMPMLVGSFLDESVTILNNLESAISANDFIEIKAHAHSIKGSAGNLKFDDIYNMAKDMELSASDSNSAFDYKAHFTSIKDAISTIPR